MYKYLTQESESLHKSNPWGSKSALASTKYLWVQIWVTHGCTCGMPYPHVTQLKRYPAVTKLGIFFFFCFGLRPALLFGILPEPIWWNYCKLVCAFHISMQEEINSIETVEAYKLMIEFSDGLHPKPLMLVLQLLFHSGHLKGQLAIWVKKLNSTRIIISEWEAHHCQVNSLKVIISNIEPIKFLLPCRSEDLGDGFTLLKARDQTAHKVFNPHELHAIQKYVIRCGNDLSDLWETHVHWWACVWLPNGQVSWSSWKESTKSLNQLCMSRNRKVSCQCKNYIYSIIV